MDIIQPDICRLGVQGIAHKKYYDSIKYCLVFMVIHVSIDYLDLIN